MLKKLTRFDESRFNEDIDVGITSKVNSGSHQIGERYAMIYQGKATNAISRYPAGRVRKGLEGRENAYGDHIVDVGDVQIIIKEYGNLALEASVTSARLLDALILKLTEKDPGIGPVELSLKEYQKMRGLKDLKDLRDQVDSDLEILKRLEVSFTDIKNGHKGDHIDMPLRGGITGIVRGVIKFEFYEPFKAMVQATMMPYPMELLQLKGANTNSYNLLRFISEHKNMNYHKTNGDIISVRKLLEAASELPRYEEIKSKGRLRERIVRPFEKSMDMIESFDWNYCLKGGKPIKGLLPRSIVDITAEERLEFAAKEGVSLDRVEELEEGFGYSEIIDLNVKITWRDYPEREKKKRKQKTK